MINENKTTQQDLALREEIVLTLQKRFPGATITIGNGADFAIDIQVDFNDDAETWLIYCRDTKRVSANELYVTASWYCLKKLSGQNKRLFLITNEDCSTPEARYLASKLDVLMLDRVSAISWFKAESECRRG